MSGFSVASIFHWRKLIRRRRYIAALYAWFLSYHLDTETSTSSKCIKLSFTKRILHKAILVTHNFNIEDRRRKVATLLAQSMTEIEIVTNNNGRIIIAILRSLKSDPNFT